MPYLMVIRLWRKINPGRRMGNAGSHIHIGWPEKGVSEKLILSKP